MVTPRQPGWWSLLLSCHYLHVDIAAGRILSWTVEFKRAPNEPSRGIIIGEMITGHDAGKRFVANTESGDAATLRWLIERCRIGEDVAIMSKGDAVRFSASGAAASL